MLVTNVSRALTGSVAVNLRLKLESIHQTDGLAQTTAIPHPLTNRHEILAHTAVAIIFIDLICGQEIFLNFSVMY